MNPDTLTTTDINNKKTFQVPQMDTTASNIALTGLVANQSALGQAYTQAQQEAQKSAEAQTTATSDITNLLQQLGGATTETQTLQEQQGIPTMTKELRDLLNLQTQQTAQYLKGFTTIEGKPISMEARSAGETALQRQHGIDALITSAQIQAKQGNIASAQDIVDRAITAKYEPIKQSIQAKQFLLQQLNTKASKDAQQANDLFLRQLEAQQKNDQDIQNIALKISEFGGNPNIIKEARTALEAIQMAGNQLQDPRAKLELTKLKLDIQKSQRELALIGAPTAKEKEAEKQALKTAEGQQTVLQDKLDLIDTIKTSPGLAQRVGPNIFARKPVGFWGGVGKAATIVGIPGLIVGGVKEATGSGQKFAGAVHRLASQEFINNLIAAKKQGATFGALTDREGDALRASATQLNDWEIKDSNGRGTGVWNIDEKTFMNEVNRIENLTRKAMGTTISPDEQQLLDSVYGAGNTTLQADPSVYFNQ